jgi:ATP/maltotriose-dependent transcriptional regulator MalT/two-component SAPR family response regulator
MISAPAGFGKTTLLVDFIADLDAPVCWYSLDESDQDPKLLLEGILASIGYHFPGCGELTQSRLLVTQDIVGEASQLIGTLTGEIYKGVSEYFIIILEDYHRIEKNESAKLLINLLIDKIPDNCHIVLSSRTNIELPALSSRILQRHAVNIDASELAFNEEEVKELLASQYSTKISDKDASQLISDSEGWVIGILMSVLGSKDSARKRQPTRLSQRDVFKFLTTEVFDRQSAEVQHFLLASSVLDVMEPSFCDRLLDTSSSGRLLSQFVKNNLFTYRIDGGQAWYRYQQLFRESLQVKLKGMDLGQYQLLNYRAAALFEKDQRWNEAITHFVAAGDYDGILRIIKEVGEDFHDSGKWATVGKWLEVVPTQILQSDPCLKLLNARGLIHLGEAAKAAQILTGLISELTDADWLNRAKALSWRSAAFRLTGHLPEARRDVEEAICVLKKHDGPADVLGDAQKRLGNIHAEQGRFKMAMRQMRYALKQYSAVYDLPRISEVHNWLGIMYKRLGRLAKASAHFEFAREGWQKTNNYGALAMALNNIGIIYQRRGQYNLALDTLRIGQEKARETGYKRIESCILISLGDILRDLTLYDEALAHYKQGLEMARQVMEISYVMHATAGMGETFRLLGDYDKAEVLLEEAISQAEERGQKYESVLFKTRLGIAEYERGRFDAAEKILLDAAKHMGRIGDKDALAKIHFHLAQVAFLTKKYRLAISWLGETLHEAEELGYYDFMAVEGRKATLLIQFGIEKQVGGSNLLYILERIRAHHIGDRELALMEISKNSRKPVKPDIEAHAFGRTFVVVDTHQIGDAEWRSSRAKELFFYLLGSRTGQTKEQITAALWPDLSPSKATSNLHINMYRARRALSPGIFTFEHGLYRINPNLNVWFDVTEFKRYVKQAENLPLDDTISCSWLEKAIELYKGPFMEEYYSEWTEAQRHELENKYLKALSKLAGYNGHRGKIDRAIALLEKFISIDPYHDDVYRQMMEWHLEAGDKISARRIYRQYIRNIAGEAEFIPPDSILELHKRISAS